MNSSGMRYVAMHMYLKRYMGGARYMFLISAHIYFSPGVRMALFQRILGMVTSAVCGVNSYEKLIKKIIYWVRCSQCRACQGLSLLGQNLFLVQGTKAFQQEYHIYTV